MKDTVQLEPDIIGERPYATAPQLWCVNPDITVNYQNVALGCLYNIFIVHITQI